MEYRYEWSGNTRISWVSWTKTQTCTQCDTAWLSETIIHCWTASNGCEQHKHLCSRKLAVYSQASGNVEPDKLRWNLCIPWCEFGQIFCPNSCTSCLINLVGVLLWFNHPTTCGNQRLIQERGWKGSEYHSHQQSWRYFSRKTLKKEHVLEHIISKFVIMSGVTLFGHPN